MIRKRNTNGFNPRTGKNRAGFTRAACVKGGSRVRGYETADDVRERALKDAKGMILREGMSYRIDYPEGKPWQKRRALSGRTNQVEIVFNGEIVKTTGETLLTGQWAFLRGE